MKILVDMNLAPRWVQFFSAAGYEALHWSQVGQEGAPDQEIMQYAANHDLVVLTHDLDFSAILAATKGMKPSVVQIRAKDISPEAIRKIIVAALRHSSDELERGALLTVEARSYADTCSSASA